MSSSKHEISPIQNEDEWFLLHSYSSEDEFVEEYNKYYQGEAKSKELYLLILNKLQKAIVSGNTDNFKQFVKVIGFISDIESRETLKIFYNDTENPIKTTNLVILACKYNRLEILKYVLNNGKVLENLSINVGKNVVTPGDKDESCHDAFYYAVLSGNVDLLETLIKNWPCDYFATRPEELDEVLSKAYEDLKLKNVSLSESMEIFVENELINLRFFSNSSGNIQINVRDKINNIIDRVDLVLEKIAFLKSEYSNGEKLDERFLFVVRFIAQNIHVLKRQFKFTYDRLPWEEIVFCLISFISSHVKQQQINLFYLAILNKSKILSYLEKFAKVLDSEKHVKIEDMNRLADIPKLKRDQVVEEIICDHPEFKDLYEDYQEIRDIYSLEKINEYLNLALSIDPEERQGQLIITRTLQVIGEYLKNTLESPKLSSATSELLLLSLPKNTRKIIIDLRNSLSHAYSLSKRTEIEENADVSFFSGVQNDTKRIYDVITDILCNKKMNMIRKLLQNIVDGENLDEIKDIAETLRIVKVDKMAENNFRSMDLEKLEKLIREISDIVVDKTDNEKKLFKQANEIIDFVKNRSKNISIDYMSKLGLLKGFISFLKGENHLNPGGIKVLKYSACTTLESMFPEKELSHDLKEIVQLSVNIYRSASSRVEGDNLDQLFSSTFEICNVAESRINDIKWLEKLKEKLYERSTFIPTRQQNQNYKALKNKYNKQLVLKLSELEKILKNDLTSGKLINKLPSYKGNKKLQAVVETLVLDVMSILGESEKHLENNLLFLDEYTPLLTGKCLRDHLAHGNTLLDVLLSDPSTAIILNAEKLITENIAKSNSKIGKFVKNDLSKLKERFDSGLVTLTNQEKMFNMLEQGHLEELKICLAQGADIHAKSLYNSWSALHFASCGPSLEVVKFVLDQNLDAEATDLNGQLPLHVAAAHGRKNIVEFFINEAQVPFNHRDNNGRTPLHIAAKSGQKDVVKILLQNCGSCYNTNDNLGFTPFHHAVQCNHVQVAEIILEKVKNVNYKASGDYTPLHIAAEFGCLEMVNFLLSCKANVHARHEKGGTPLHTMGINGHPEIVRAIVLKGADVNAEVLGGCTTLHYLVEHGHLEATDILLKHGANPNIPDKIYYNTPLHYAAKYGHHKIVESLLSYKADANLVTVERITPLHFAVRGGHLKIVASLLKHGVIVDARNITRWTALHCAAEFGHKDMAQLLIQHGAEVDAKTNKNLTPLHIAALEGHKDVVNLLIKNKAKVDAKDMNGNTPLTVAAQRGKVEICDLLIKNKCKIDVRNNDGMTPLHAAAYGGHKSIVEFLLKNRADVNTKATNGFTPLHGAILNGNKDVVEFLIKNKVEVNAAGTLPGTSSLSELEVMPLHLAIESGQKEIVQVLIANKADVNARKNGVTPLMTAIRSGFKEIIEVLLANGADVDSKGGAPLFAAIMKNRTDIVNILLQNNARVDFVRNGSTVLHLAAQIGNKDIANAVVIKGAKVDALNSDDMTPLYISARRGHEEVGEVLIAGGANVNYCGYDGTPLHAAAGCGFPSFVKLLLRNGANVNVKDGDNRLPLELAVGHCHLPVVKVLLQHKTVNLNAKGNADWTILHIASQEDNLETVKYLVEKGSNIHAKNSSGSKPIHIAAREGFRDIVEFYLSKGLDVNEPGTDNQIPLHYVAMKDCLEVAKCLISKGADVNAKDVNGFTPLHFAAVFGYENIIKILLENGAVYNPTNNGSVTPLRMITDRNYLSIRDTSSQNYMDLTKNQNLSKLFTSTEKLFESVKRKSTAEVKSAIKSGAFVNAKSASNETTPLHYAAWKGCDQIVDILLENEANPNAICSGRFTPLHYAAKFSHFECVKALLYHGAVYNPISTNGKTPLKYTSDENIINLLKLIEESFKKVKNADVKVIDELDNLKDPSLLKAIMNTCNRDNKTLIAVAPQQNLLFIEKLKNVSQGDTLSELEKAVDLLNGDSCQPALIILNRIFIKRKQLLGPDNLATLDIQVYIARGLYRQGHYQEALDILEKVFQKQKEMLGFKNKYTLDTRSAMALVFYRQEKHDEAYEIFQEVLKTQKELLGSSHSDIIDTQFHLALVLDSLGRYDEALRINEYVYKIRKKTLGTEDISTVIVQNNIALVLSHLGKFEDSLKIYNQVLEKKKSILGIGHTDTLRTLNSIAGILFKQNKHQEAVEAFQQLLDLQKKHLKRNHPELLNTQYNLANVLHAHGRHISALQLFKECYDQRKSVFGSNDPSVKDIEKKIKFINFQLKVEGSSESEVTRNLQKDINIVASKGDIESLKLLLKDGADVNGTDIDGRTPLHFAVSNAHVEMVNVLLQSGADVTQATNKGNTPLHTAATKRNNKIIQILLQHVSPNKLNDFVNAKTASGGMTSLHIAARSGCLDIVKSLLNNGAIYDIVNNQGQTPIDVSTDQEIIELLELIDELFKGIEKGSIEATNKLKEIGLDDFSAATNARNSQGHKLLQVAVVDNDKQKQTNIANELLEIMKRNQH